MDHDRWVRLEQLYHAALERDEGHRAAFLEQACGEDASLRAELESLLAFDEKGRDFLETPAFDLVAKSLAGEKETAQAAAGQSLIGQTIAHFRVVEKLGAGGMGSVYKAEDTRLRRFVALKFLPEELEWHPRAFDRLRREAQAASALNHPNICTVYDIGESEGRPFIAMELLEGQTLRVWLGRDAPVGRLSSPQETAQRAVSTDTLLDLAIQITDALDAAHQKGIVHRDIKPQNIFIVPRGETFQAKVLDFGIARQSSESGPAAAAQSSCETEDGTGAATLTGFVQGTPSYMSPEQARAEQLDTRTDLFSFGAVLYEMATGQQAFPGNSLPLVFDAILNREPPSASPLNPEIPPGLDAIIRKALEKNREARYQTAADLRADLKRLKDDTASAQAAAAAGGRHVPLLAGRWLKSPWLWAGACLVVAALAVAAFLLPRPTAQESLGFHRRDWVLVSRFENRTGNRVLDGTVDFAVAQELSNSQFVNVVPPQRIGDALRLMEKPLSTPLTPAVAREICLRDGGIRALITGRVEKVGTIYDLTAGIVDPATDVQVEGLESQAADLNGVLPAVRQLSNQLRAALGEDLSAIQESNVKLEKVTTPSLRALQLYSQAINLSIQQGFNRDAIPLLEQALADDPNFAMAHIFLALFYSSIAKPNLAAPHFKRAFELASSISERERLFILGSYYQNSAILGFSGHLANLGDMGRSSNPSMGKAFQAYEALVRLYPDDYWGTLKLENLYFDTDRLSEAAEMAARLANLRPAIPRLSEFAAQWLFLTGQEAEAQPFFLKVNNMMTPTVERNAPYMPQELWVLMMQSDLRARNVKGALDEAQHLADSIPPQAAAVREALAPALVSIYVELGKLKRAEGWAQRLPADYPWRQAYLARLSHERGDLRATRNALGRLKGPELLNPVLAVRLAHCGMLSAAQHELSRLDKSNMAPWMGADWGEGSLALAEGRNGEAARLLTEFTRRFSQFDFYSYSLEVPGDDLATAYEREGRISDAIQTLQPLEAKGYLSPRAIFHLYKLYLKTGDDRDAQLVRADLLHRLAYADPDYPVLVELHHEEDHHVAALAKH